MPIRFSKAEQLALIWSLTKWSILGAWVGVLAGIASAVFLFSLEWANKTRAAHPQLLFFLPLSGVLIWAIYDRFGRAVQGGNNLLLETVHDPKEAIPFRMAPLILLTTVLTHLFGGSAGREGTAVQMGGTLGQLATLPLRLGPEHRRILVMAGIAGGFGSVFGTPIAGTVFGLEVLAIGRLRYDGLIACLSASVVGDIVCRELGTHHTDYFSMLGRQQPLAPVSLLLVVVAGLLFGCSSALFSELTHAVQHWINRFVPKPYLKSFTGGCIVIAMTLLAGSQIYNGLGLELIAQSLVGKVFLAAFLIKIVFTAVTLGAGFKGGEVTPLFCIGATAGNAFAQITHQPTAVFAAIGFVSVFSGAANTPLACIVMGVELFGTQLAVPIAIGCVTAYIFSGHRGIYSSQRIGHPKSDQAQDIEDATLGAIRLSGVAVRLATASRWFRKN